MISKIEIQNYRCLKSVSQNLSAFNVLIGPNGSGKSSFIDAIWFLRDLLSERFEDVLKRRSESFQDLLFNRGKDVPNVFRILVEAAVPDDIKDGYMARRWQTVSYAVRITAEDLQRNIRSPFIWSESVEVRDRKVGPEEVFIAGDPNGPARTILHRDSSGRTFLCPENWSDEERKAGTREMVAQSLRHPVLPSLPAAEEDFPATRWLAQLLQNGVRKLMLDPTAMKHAVASLPTQIDFSDGGDLPLLVRELLDDAGRFEQWISHLRLVLPDLDRIEVTERPEDNKSYIRLITRSGASLPSWLLSDGTLRLLALTIRAYVSEENHVYLIEEIENGIHPAAVEVVLQSLSSIYGSQVLLTTHSPLMLSLMQPSDLLVFSYDTLEGTKVGRGSDHPMLAGWSKDISLSDLFAAGVLS